MKGSKDFYLEMQEQRIAEEYPTKKQVKKNAEVFVESIIDSGEYNMQELYANVLRFKETVTVIESKLKTQLGEENFEAFGLKASFRNGGDTINYSEDEIVAELETKLKERKELLKTSLAITSEVYDENGVEVPKVSKTPRKSSLSISF